MKPSYEMCLKLRETHAMIEELEEFTCVELAATKELIRIVLAAYEGNEACLRKIQELQAGERHKRENKGAPHDRLRIVRETRADPADQWEINPPGKPIPTA